MERTQTTAFIYFVFRLIPMDLRRVLFKAVFRLIYHVSVEQRLIALHNLRNAYPDKPIDELEGIAKGVYHHMAIVMAELFETPFIRKETLHEWLDVEGLENLERAYEQGRGFLSLVAHFGNWELMPVVVPLLSRPTQIVYRPLDSPVMDNLLGWSRTRHGNVLIPKERAGLQTIRCLRKNWAVGILSDQNVDTHEGVFVDFFVRPACSSVGLAVLARQSGAPVIPAFLPRMPDGRYKLVVLPPVEVAQTDDYESDLLVNTQRFNKIVENVVRQYPEQWFCLHQRWKTKPWQGADRIQKRRRRLSGKRIRRHENEDLKVSEGQTLRENKYFGYFLAVTRLQITSQGQRRLAQPILFSVIINCALRLSDAGLARPQIFPGYIPKQKWTTRDRKRREHSYIVMKKIDKNSNSHTWQEKNRNARRHGSRVSMKSRTSFKKVLTAADRYEIGVTLLLADRASGAIRAFDRSIELNPFVASTYLKRGRACEMTGDFQSALDYYRMASELSRTVALLN